MIKVRIKAGGPFIIRRAGSRDLAAVLAIEQASFSTPWSAEMYLAEMGRDGSIFLVAEERGVLVGYVCAWRVLDEVHLLKLAVHPAQRRDGIGTRLMTALLQELPTSAGVEIWLEVRESNLAGRGFYRRLGFTEFGRRRKYYPDTDEDAVVMMKRIRRGERDRPARCPSLQERDE